MRPAQVGGRTGAQSKRWAQRTPRLGDSRQTCAAMGLCGPGPRAEPASELLCLWYMASMVSDCKVFLGKKDHLLMSTRSIKAFAGGNLSVHMEFPR